MEFDRLVNIPIKVRMQTGTIDTFNLPDLSQFGEIGKVVMVLANRIRELESRDQVMPMPSNGVDPVFEPAGAKIGYGMRV